MRSQWVKSSRELDLFRPDRSRILRTDQHEQVEASSGLFVAANDAPRVPGPAPVPAGTALAAPTVFHEHWWLDAVAPGAWEAASVEEKGRLVAWWPYVVSRHRGFDVSRMPTLSHLLGPVVTEGHGSPNKRWLRRIDLLAELSARLPKVAAFSQICHPGMTEVLGLQACGFSAAAQFSAEVQPVAAPVAWGRMRDKTRNVIRRAQERLSIETLDDIDSFLHHYRQNLTAAGQTSYYDYDRLRSVYAAARQRQQAVIKVALGEGGVPAAGALFVWDEQRLWYYLSTRSPSEAGNGGVSLLVWDGIQEAARRQLVFDFDGIAGSGAARFYAGFGAEIRPRFGIHRRSAAYALVGSLLDMVRPASTNPFVAC